MADVYKAWWTFLVAIGVAFIYCFLYMWLIKCCASVMVWTSLILIALLIGAGGYYLFNRKDKYESDSDNYKTNLYAAYGTWGFLGLYILCMLCCCNRIRLAVAIMEATADFVASNLRVFILPIISFFVIIVFFAWWVVTALFVYSVGEPAIGTGVTANYLPNIVWDQNTRYIWLYHVFGCLWFIWFIVGCTQFVIATMAATWYFTHDSDSKGSASVCKGICWLCRYHAGSIAFGSLIIAIVTAIKIAFEYYRKQYEKMLGKNNPLTKFIVCCTRYIISCLDRCIKFITKNAYIQVVLRNKSFCPGAWTAFLLILKNAGRFAVLTSIGGIFQILGRLLILSATVLTGYVVIEQLPDVIGELYSPLGPLIVYGLVAWVIAACFLAIYSFASDVILQCFLLDEELAGAGKTGPHRPKSLEKFAGLSHGNSCCC